MLNEQEMRERTLNPEQKEIIDAVVMFQARVRNEVRLQLLRQSAESLSEVVAYGAGDVTYRIDAHTEEYIIQFGRDFSQKHPCMIIAEGIGVKKFPEGKSNLKPEFRIIIDPIDGTREIMYDKRSAWVLTGVAKDKGEKTNLSDIDVAIMTEIPPTKQNIGSVVWAVKQHGAYEDLWDLEKNKMISRRKLSSSRVTDIRHGFVVFGDYGRGSKEEIGRLADSVFDEILGPVEEGQFLVFNDQYVCAAGQIYLIASGKYRFVADLRPEMDKVLGKKGKKVGLAAHPYDLCTTLVAQEAGAIVTDEKGQALTYPLDTETGCNWVVYANKDIRKLIEPVLHRQLNKLLKE